LDRRGDIRRVGKGPTMKKPEFGTTKGDKPPNPEKEAANWTLPGGRCSLTVGEPSLGGKGREQHNG